MADLDAAAVRAACAAAGALQEEANEIGIEDIAEADVRRAVRRALQMQLGPVVRPEGAKRFKLPDWVGKMLGPDVVVSHAEGGGWRAFFEAKWLREDKMFEVLWDLLKISSAVSLDGVDAGYLVVGGPGHAWEGEGWRCADLIETGRWEVADLFERYRPQWAALLKGNLTARPTRLPSAVATTLLAKVPIHLAAAADWQLRLLRVEDPGEGWIELSEGWPLAV